MGMSKLTSKQVEHVARLAKLDLTKEEVLKFADQLSAVVEYFDSLPNFSFENVESTSQTTGLTNVFREDAIDTTRILPVEEVISGTENIHNNYFKVPLILKHKQ